MSQGCRRGERLRVAGIDVERRLAASRPGKPEAMAGFQVTEVQEALKSANYPMDGSALADLAQSNGADQEVVDRLRGLREVEGLNGVMKELKGDLGGSTDGDQRRESLPAPGAYSRAHAGRSSDPHPEAAQQPRRAGRRSLDGGRATHELVGPGTPARDHRCCPRWVRARHVWRPRRLAGLLRAGAGRPGQLSAICCSARKSAWLECAVRRALSRVGRTNNAASLKAVPSPATPRLPGWPPARDRDRGRGHAVTVVVTDDGGGATERSTSRGGYGLVSMSERVERCGGRLTAGPAHQGFGVHALTPGPT